MNFFKRIWIKHLIKKEFKKNFVDTGYVRSFKVLWDSDKKDYLINYIPVKTRNLEDMREPEILEDEQFKDDYE